MEVRAAAIDRAHRHRVDEVAPFATVDVVHGDDYVATVKLEVRGSVETREVRGASCAELADAVAWMIALAWPPEPVHLYPSELPPPPPPLPPAPSPFHVHASARSAVDLGTLPGVDAGVGLALGIAHDRGVELEVGGTYWKPRFDALMDGSSAGLEVGLAAASAQVCVAFAYVCAGVEAGYLTGRGVELADEHAAALPWVAATAGARVRRRLSRAVAVVVDAGAIVAVSRPQFTFDDGAVVFRPAAVAARIAVSVEFLPFR